VMSCIILSFRERTRCQFISHKQHFLKPPSATVTQYPVPVHGDYMLQPTVSVPLLFTALCTSTRSNGRYNMDLNKYFLLSRFPRKVVNSISNIPATGRRHNSYLKPTERIKTIGNPTRGSQQYHSEPEKSINLKTSGLQRRDQKT
jgi:hypothetical protein